MTPFNHTQYAQLRNQAVCTQCCITIYISYKLDFTPLWLKPKDLIYGHCTGWPQTDLPANRNRATKACSVILYIPIYPFISQAHIIRIVKLFISFCKRRRYKPVFRKLKHKRNSVATIGQLLWDKCENYFPNRMTSGVAHMLWVSLSLIAEFRMANT